MKKTINYEKDILFKTNIGEMCSISLEHDFTVDNGYLRGEFLVEGEYKPNGLSLNREPFSYRLPLEYELERNVDFDTLSYDIENFEYNVHEDELSVYIDFGIRYDEKVIEPTIPFVTEEELNSLDFGDIDLPMFKEKAEHREVEVQQASEEQDDVDNVDEELEVRDSIKHEEYVEDTIKNKLDDQDKDLIMNTVLEGDDFVTYHVHIVREGDTLESISLKYNCSIDLIKEYNDTENIELLSKLIIPQEKNE